VMSNSSTLGQSTTSDFWVRIDGRPLVTPTDVTAERARIGALIKRKIDGLIVIPCQDDSPVLEDLRRSEIPTALWIV
jgi:hypothetical protein